MTQGGVAGVIIAIWLIGWIVGDFWKMKKGYKRHRPGDD